MLYETLWNVLKLLSVAPITHIVQLIGAEWRIYASEN